MESYVLSYSYVSSCIPELNRGSAHGQRIECRNIIGVSAENCVLFSVNASYAYAEGAYASIILVAIAETCGPSVRITLV